MPRRKLTHSKADFRAQWEVMEKMGLNPVSVKYHPDGTFRIMTAKHAEINKPPSGSSGSGNTGGANFWDKLHDPA
jgi:hypothetical protein